MAAWEIFPYKGYLVAMKQTDLKQLWAVCIFILCQLMNSWNIMIGIKQKQKKSNLLKNILFSFPPPVMMIGAQLITTYWVLSPLGAGWMWCYPSAVVDGCCWGRSTNSAVGRDTHQAPSCILSAVLCGAIRVMSRTGQGSQQILANAWTAFLCVPLTNFKKSWEVCETAGSALAARRLQWGFPSFGQTGANGCWWAALRVSVLLVSRGNPMVLGNLALLLLWPQGLTTLRLFSNWGFSKLGLQSMEFTREMWKYFKN